MSIIVYQDVATPIVPVEGLAGRIRDALGASLRSMRYPTPDFAGLYQDAAGTTPVTAVGQPVGLMLDRRFGLVVSPTNHAPPLGVGWALSAGVTQGNGAISFVGSDNYSAAFAPGVNGYVVGGDRFYEFEFDIADYVSGLIMFRFGSGSETFVVRSSGTHRGRSKSGSVSNENLVFNTSNFTGRVTRLLVREIPGDHASQPTTTARPTLRSGPLRIDYDGVDDYLRTVFPALGSNVTIARSIPGVGAQILTGQTIAAGNWDDNVTSCATLVIDRALTGPETALVTAFLNQQAGV